MLSTAYSYCLANNDVGNAACHLDQLGTVGVSDLILCKTSLEFSVMYPLFLLPEMNQTQIDTWAQTKAESATDLQGNLQAGTDIKLITDKRMRDTGLQGRELQLGLLVKWHHGGVL